MSGRAGASHGADSGCSPQEVIRAVRIIRLSMSPVAARAGSGLRPPVLVRCDEGLRQPAPVALRRGRRRAAGAQRSVVRLFGARHQESREDSAAQAIRYAGPSDSEGAVPPIQGHGYRQL